MIMLGIIKRPFPYQACFSNLSSKHNFQKILQIKYEKYIVIVKNFF